jgi:hypothetical protein
MDNAIQLRQPAPGRGQRLGPGQGAEGGGPADAPGAKVGTVDIVAQVADADLPVCIAAEETVISRPVPRPGKMQVFRSGKVVFRSYERKLRLVTSIDTMQLKQGGVKFFLRWPGGPDAFELAKLEGEVSGNIRQGVFTGVKEGYQWLFNGLSVNPGDIRKRRLEFYKAAFSARAKKGPWEVDVAKGLVGSVFVKMTGTTDTAKRIHDLRLKSQPGVEDICEEDLGGLSQVPDCGKPPKELLKEPNKFVKVPFYIKGSWDLPDVGLDIL